MRVHSVAFLACGWSLASTRAHATAIALQTDEGVILVDAGGDAIKGLVRTFGTEQLSHIYLTHEHPDHLYALPGLIHHLRFADEREALHIHGPAPALERAQAALDALGVRCPFELAWGEIAVEAGGDDRARWVPAAHSVPTLAYRFGDVVVCGDTAPSERIEELAQGASLLVHEASHTDERLTHENGHATPADAGRIAAAAEVDHLALIHVHPSLGPAGAVDACPFGPVTAPIDGLILEREGGTWREQA